MRVGSFVDLVTRGMEEKGISLRMAAREIGLDPSFFSKVLAQKRTPPSDEKILRKLAKVLDIDPVLLVISTGTIPRELQARMEDPDFIRSIREGSPLTQARMAPAPAAVRGERKPARTERVEPVRSIRKTPELSEDLL